MVYWCQLCSGNCITPIGEPYNMSIDTHARHVHAIPAAILLNSQHIQFMVLGYPGGRRLPSGGPIPDRHTPRAKYKPGPMGGPLKGKSKPKGKGKGPDKGKGKGKDKGKDKGSDKGKDPGKDKGKGKETNDKSHKGSSHKGHMAYEPATASEAPPAWGATWHDPFQGKGDDKSHMADAMQPGIGSQQAAQPTMPTHFFHQHQHRTNNPAPAGQRQWMQVPQYNRGPQIMRPPRPSPPQMHVPVPKQQQHQALMPTNPIRSAVTFLTRGKGHGNTGNVWEGLQ
eukprot:8328163-Karenia_brevis.AAC.1